MNNHTLGINGLIMNFQLKPNTADKEIPFFTTHAQFLIILNTYVHFSISS